MAFLSDQDFYQVGINFGKSSHSSSFLELITHEILMSTIASPEGKLLIHDPDRGLSLIVDFDIVQLTDTSKFQCRYLERRKLKDSGPPHGLWVSMDRPNSSSR